MALNFRRKSNSSASNKSAYGPSAARDMRAGSGRNASTGRASGGRRASGNTSGVRTKKARGGVARNSNARSTNTYPQVVRGAKATSNQTRARKQKASKNARQNTNAYKPLQRNPYPKSHGSSKGYAPASAVPEYNHAPNLSSVSIGEIDRAARAERTRKTYKRHVIRVMCILLALACIAAACVALYFSDAFKIESVQVKGVEHLTAQEMEALANVPSNTTLLRVDTSAIKSNLLRDAWVKSVSIDRIFPSTLQITITERTIAAVVEVPVTNATTTQPWAIASDGMWLMAIPDQDSELGQSISSKIYEDAQSALRITDVPLGTQAETGTYCSDDNVNNALAIVSGMTTSLADEVVQVKATDAESTLLILDSGVEIAFGQAENIRDKERVCQEILEENSGQVAYINVRVVDRPTWRSAS